MEYTTENGWEMSTKCKQIWIYTKSIYSSLLENLEQGSVYLTQFPSYYWRLIKIMRTKEKADDLEECTVLRINNETTHIYNEFG